MYIGHNKKDCSVDIVMTDELTQYLKDQFKVHLDNKVKFDQNNNNLLVDVSYSGGK